MGGIVGSIFGSGNGSNYQAQMAPITTQNNLVDQIGAQQSQEGQLAQALQLQSQGQGPNPALAQLKMSTDQNNRQAAGMVASQKGLNPALAAQMSQGQMATSNQASSGQAALLGAQQQLQAQSQLAGLNMGQQQSLQQALAAQNQAQVSNYGQFNAANAGVAQQNANNQGKTGMGLLGGLGSALGLSSGGTVPGKAQVVGDSTVNDTVPALLSPGEIVIPRTKASNPETAREYLEKILANKQKEEPNSYARLISAHKELGNLIRRAKMSDGGEVEPPPEMPSPVTTVPGGPIPDSSDLPSFPSTPDPQGQYGQEDAVPPPPAMPSPPNASDSTEDEASDPNSADQSPVAVRGVPLEPQATNNPLAGDPYAQAFAEEKAGVNQEAAAQGDLGSAQSKVLGDAVQQSRNEAQEFQRHYAASMARSQQLAQAIGDSTIDPSRFWNNKSTGSKIASMIGVFLGGASPNGNDALRYLQSQINNDINSQVANVGNKKTLLESSYRDSGDILAAHTQAQSDMWTAVKAQVQQASAAAQGPLAKAQAHQLLGQIDQKQAELHQRMAMFQMQSQANGGGVPENQAGAYKTAFPDMGKRMVKVGNMEYTAPDEKTADEIRDTAASAEPIKSTLARLDSLGPTSLVPGSSNYNVARGLQARLVTQIGSLGGKSPRFSEQFINTTKEQFSDPTSLKQILARGVRTNEFVKTLEDETEAQYSKLNGYKGSLAARGKVKPGFK